MSSSVLRRCLAAAAATVALGACSSGGSVVDRITIVNQTVYDLEVKATDTERDGWILLGSSPRGSETGSTEVEDLGDEWVFRFEYAGRVLGGELRIDRDDLERRDWRVEVPDDVERRLRKEGIEPSPDDG